MARMGAYVASSPISTLWLGGAWAGLFILLPMLALVTGVTKRKKNNRWCPKAMKACLAELSEAAHFKSGLPFKMRATCEKWGVPRSTVKRYFEASKQPGAVTTAPPGRPRLLTSEEEEQVVDTILRHHKNGCALNHFQVKWLLMEIVRHVPRRQWQLRPTARRPRSHLTLPRSKRRRWQAGWLKCRLPYLLWSGLLS